MNRNMQLAHQAKTKKKISKDSLFARFNFRTSSISAVTMPEHPTSSTMPSSTPVSDGEDTRLDESPPTSPVEIVHQPLGRSILSSKTTMQGEEPTTSTNHASDHCSDYDELPETADLLKQTWSLDKGKAKAIDTTSPPSTVSKKKRSDFKQRPIRVSLPKASLQVGSIDLDSETDSEKPAKHRTRTSRSTKAKLDAFKRLPANKFQEGRSLLTLRALAHLNSPDDRGRSKKSSVNVADMQMSLQRRARMQALEERKSKIDDLKARGILIQSAEEREKDQAEVENLVEKARRQAEELQQKEKRAAKKQKIANGELDGLGTSDEDEEDGDYEDGEDGDADVELSGSEEEANNPSGADEQESDENESELEEDADDLQLIGEDENRMDS